LEEGAEKELSWWWPLATLGATTPIIIVVGVIGYHQVNSLALQAMSQVISQAKPLVVSKTDLTRVSRFLGYFSEDLGRRVRDAEWRGLGVVWYPEVGRIDLATAKDWVSHARESAAKVGEAVELMTKMGVEEITITPALRVTPVLKLAVPHLKTSSSQVTSLEQPVFRYTNLLKIVRYLEYFGDNLARWVREAYGARRRFLRHPVIGRIDVETAERMVSEVRESANKMAELAKLMFNMGVEEITLTVTGTS
jgi:hypothetical protein